MRMSADDRIDAEQDDFLEEVEALDRPQFLNYERREHQYITFGDAVFLILARLAFAAGLSALVGGFGLVLARSEERGAIGAVWMAVGGFLLGLVLPVPQRRQ